MGVPQTIREEDLKAAAEGKSEHVLGPGRPLDVSESDVKSAGQGKSETVLKGKKPKPIGTTYEK